jgi:hypothetical protein
MRYIVLDGFCPWVRGGCIACSGVRGGFHCGEDMYPSSHVQRTIENLQLTFFLASLVIWLFSCFHGFWDNFVSSSYLYTLWNTCFKCTLIEWYDVSLICVCVILAPFLASASACSFSAFWQCPGIHCSAVCLCFALSCRIRTWQSLVSVDITVMFIPQIVLQPLCQKR